MNELGRMGGHTSNGSGWQVGMAFIWLATGISGASRKHGDASLDFIKGGEFLFTSLTPVRF
jgi:hypothetical protein